MKKSILILITMILMMAGTASATIVVDTDTIFTTFDNKFNYTFDTNLSFDYIDFTSDTYVQFNYTNITVNPGTETGNATIHTVTSDLVNMTVCGAGQNVNIKFENISAEMVYIIDGSYEPYTAATNKTFNATGSCREINLIKDSTAPSITLVNPTPGNNTILYSSDLTIWAQISETYPETCILTFDSTNYTMTRTGSTCTYSFSGLETKEYAFEIIANDSAGHSTSTGIYTFTTSPNNIVISDTTTSPSSGSGTGTVTADTTIQTAVDMYESPNPVIVGGKTTLSCKYTYSGGIVPDPTIKFTVNGEDQTGIQLSGDTYYLPMNFDEPGKVTWTCTASKAGYQTIAKTRIIDVLNMADARDYLEQVADELMETAVNGTIEDTSKGVLDGDKESFISPTGNVLLSKIDNQTKNVIMFIAIVLIVAFLVLRK